MLGLPALEKEGKKAIFQIVQKIKQMTDRVRAGEGNIILSLCKILDLIILKTNIFG